MKLMKLIPLEILTNYGPDANTFRIMFINPTQIQGIEEDKQHWHPEIQTVIYLHGTHIYSRLPLYTVHDLLFLGGKLDNKTEKPV